MGDRRPSDITDPAAIRAAVQEYDELGGEAFLARYGFAPARVYELILNGRRYPSKAIVGAAYAKQHPGELPLSPSEFSGGERTVRERLQRLGFAVHTREEPARRVSDEAVTAALDEWDEIGRDAFLLKYGAASASKFLISRDDESYDAKAIVLAAYQRQFGIALNSSDFRGSRQQIADPLRKLGFMVIEVDSGHHPALKGAPTNNWDLYPGQMVRRVELHERFGGSGQDGVSPSRKTPNILLFSDPTSGHRYGYVDEWTHDGAFLYTGHGQRGDQEFVRGNRAIRDHVNDGRSLRLFQGASGTVRYVGEFTLDDDAPYEWTHARQAGSSELRRVIRFRLRPVRSSVISLPGAKSGAPYRRQHESSGPAISHERRDPDPDTFGRGFNAHKRLQNDLADMAQAAGLIPQSPAPYDPDFDLAWRSDDNLIVVEVKSLTTANQTRQLRMGIGQVLDYTDVLTQRGEHVRPVLYIEKPPSDLRWVTLAVRHGVRLAWPASAHELFDASQPVT